LYALSWSRTVAGNIEITETDPLFLRRMKQEGFLSPELTASVRRTGRIPGDARIPRPLRDLFETAFEIPPETHIRMQAAFQRHTDNAVSKTVNFPPSAEPEDVREAFLLAHELRCKGITVYRDGSRAGQVLRCGLHRPC
nr:ribonucleotide-diphosphate reductase subunit alpha [Syntrophales bacterium]